MTHLNGNEPQPAQLQPKQKPTTLTAAETARLMKNLGFNWLDIEFVLELAPHQPKGGHMHYEQAVLERFVGRAIWLPETPFSKAHAATADKLPQAA